MLQSWADLVDLADPGSEERGRAYARENRVRITAQSPDEVLAVVEGTDQYQVRLRADDFSCECPMGRSDVFCKHCVAVALVASGQRPTDGEQVDGELDEGADPVAGWLDTLDAGQLRELVSEAAATSEAFDQMLQIRAARALGDVSHLHSLVDQTLRTRRFLDWRASSEYAYEAQRLVDELDHTLARDTAEAMLSVLERAVGILYRVVGRADDSGGGIGEVVHRMLSLHAKAAGMARTDPKRLARWLAKAGLDDTDVFTIDVDDYQGPLGAKGIAVYRKEVDKRLAAKPDLFAARRALERLAIVDGDVAQVVAIVGGDLHAAYQYLRVVDALLDMKQHEEALRFAVQGLDAPVVPHQTARLYDTAADLLTARGEPERVVELRHRQMEQMPSEQSYARLRHAAKDTDAWPRARAWALELLLTRQPTAWLSAVIDEGEIDLAWDAAQDMDLSPSQFHRLLRERAKQHPEEVFDGYAALVHAELRTTGQQAYRRAVGHLRELRTVTERSGQQPAFDALVGELVVAHKRRPTLVRMLQRLGGPTGKV